MLSSKPSTRFLRCSVVSKSGRNGTRERLMHEGHVNETLAIPEEDKR